MLFRFSPVACAAVAALSTFTITSTAHSQEVQQTGVLVSATRIDMQDSDAPYASEVHTRSDIERSGATTLFDYIAQQTSLHITPSFGNRFNPKISMRGYGNDGYQNLTISVDGRSISSMDMIPQHIGAISLANIDRIEITKGSGAVLFGDHATSGTIQIYTKAREHASLDTYVGNHGQRGAVASVGLVRDKFDISASADHGKFEGLSDADPTGHSDQSEANIWHIAATVKPITGLRLQVQSGESNLDTRFPNELSRVQFKAAPGMASNPYTQDKTKSQYWGLGADYQFNDNWNLSLKHHEEDKDNSFSWQGNPADLKRYQHDSNDIALQFHQGGLLINAGWQLKQSKFQGPWNMASKKNRALYVQSQFVLEDWTLSAGMRHEKITTANVPVSGQALSDGQFLNAWEMGANRRLTEDLSIFASYSDAFNTADTDRFGQNPAIKPAKSRTLTVGVNHVAGSHRLKASLFYAKLHDEIYYYSTEFQNTNIDESHKYGLELQDRYQITPHVSALINYNWTRALIDREDEGAGAFNGKELPGVSRHSLVLGLNVRVANKGDLALTHTWRSSAWTEEDFANAQGHKQQAFQSTDLSYRHQVAKQLEIYGSVSNLFARKNGYWINADSIYPYHFERNWKFGARIQY